MSIRSLQYRGRVTHPPGEPPESLPALDLHIDGENDGLIGNTYPVINSARSASSIVHPWLESFRPTRHV